MNPLTCELCGSKDLLKQEGVFVCQNCGTKYSIEEAKNMMIIGTVDVSGSTVKVDNSTSIKNYFTMATSAYEADNKAEAESYCNKIIEIEPENYAAWFLKGRAAGWQSTPTKVRIEESVQCFSKAIDYSPQNNVEKLKKSVSNEIYNLSISIISICCNNFTQLPNTSNADLISNNVANIQICLTKLREKCGIEATGVNAKIALLINKAACDAMPNIEKDYMGDDGHPDKYAWEKFKTTCFDIIRLLELAVKINDQVPKNNINIYKNLIQATQRVIQSCSWREESVKSYQYVNGHQREKKHYIWVIDCSLTNEEKEKLIDNIMNYHNKIKELDPDYVVPERSTIKKGGCYVATCIYGSYDCPQVWTLRRYRDYTLAKTWYGRAFIHTYYAISPTIVKLFGNTNWFKRMWKDKLDRMIDKLRTEGVEDTPYQDKEW